MKILKIKSSALSKLLFVLVAIDLLILTTILIISSNKNVEKKSEEILYASIPTPTLIPLSPLPTPAPIPEDWNSYTITNFNFTQEMANEYPEIAKGNLTFQYPNSWYINKFNSTFSNQKKYGVFTGIDLRKDDPAFRNSPQGEGPKPNSIFITFIVKETSKTPNELVDNFEDEFGYGNIWQIPVKNTFFNGYKTAIIRTSASFPESLLLPIDENTVLLIHAEYYADDKKSDYNQKYNEDSAREINQILSSVRFTQQ